MQGMTTDGIALKKILSLLRRADQDFGLIRPGDRVMAGVSGGKDSLVLLAALAAYRRFTDNPFELCAGLVDMGFGDFDIAPLAEYCASLGMELHVKSTHIGRVIFEKRRESNPCSLCAKMRRGALNELAKKHGYNKIALGHHRDDLVETLLMSMIYESRLKTFAPVVWMDKEDIEQVRPLVYAEEREIAGAAKRLGLPVAKSACPASGNTKRQEMKELVKHLRTLCPDVDIHLFRAIRNTGNYDLWDNIRRRPDGTHSSNV
jgi:tRNA 2-thiocytidine biosynthesis protein TtcA